MRMGLKDEIMEAAQFGIAAVGHDKALDAALRMQTKSCSDLFALISGMHRHAQANGCEGRLPLNDEVIDVYNHAAYGVALVAAIMSIHEDAADSASTVEYSEERHGKPN